MKKPTIKIYTDGGTHMNRICIVDKHIDKNIVKTRGVNPTNNELEYLAVLYALKYIQNNYKRYKVTICSDSMLVVNQLNDKWRVTTPTLIPLHAKCAKLLKSNIIIKWVSRDVNEAGWILDKLLKARI